MLKYVVDLIFQISISIIFTLKMVDEDNLAKRAVIQNAKIYLEYEIFLLWKILITKLK